MHPIQTAEPEAWYTVAAECMRSLSLFDLWPGTPCFSGSEWPTPWSSGSGGWKRRRGEEARCYVCRVLAITSEAPQWESSGCCHTLLLWLCSSHTHSKRLWTIPHHYSKQKNKTLKWDTSTRGERAQNTQWHHHNFLFLSVAMIPGNLHTSGDWWTMSQEGRAQFLLSGHNRTSSLCVPPESWAKYGRDLLHPLGQRRSEWPNSLHSVWPIGIHDIMLTRPHK